MLVNMRMCSAANAARPKNHADKNEKRCGQKRQNVASVQARGFPGGLLLGGDGRSIGGPSRAGRVVPSQL
jgi:hypothetical protein